MLFKQVFCSTCLLTENRSTNQDFFPMLHHEESPEKLQYNMAISYFALPPFIDSPPPPPPISINFEKVESPLL